MEEEREMKSAQQGVEEEQGEGITNLSVTQPTSDANLQQIQSTNGGYAVAAAAAAGGGGDVPPSTIDDPALLAQQLENVGLVEGNGRQSAASEDADKGGGRGEGREKGVEGMGWATGGGEEDDGNIEGDSSHPYPLRPYAVDCMFYLKTGTCKYGFNCRFNHPLKTVLYQANGVDKENQGHGSSEDVGKIKCRYYLTPGGCKYGDSCRYDHSKETGSESPPLNFLGLPIRLGVKECPFYMRYGSCAYETNCRFHHPDPAEAKEAPDQSLVNDDSGRCDPSSQSYIHKYVPTSSLGLSQASLAVNGATPEYGSSSLPFDSLQGIPHNSGWTQYQVAEYPERPGQPECAYFMTTGNCKYKSACRYHHPKSILKNDQNKAGRMGERADTSIDYQLMQYTEFPERPGQPECQYFMKTGDCKFRSACRYHHPKIRLTQFPVTQLMVNGLPSRPAAISPLDNSQLHYMPSNYLNSKTYKQQQQKILVEEYPERPGELNCDFYMRTGDCKYRSACLYHHPKNRASASPSFSLSDKGLPRRPGGRI
ncbi:hypothetical protein Dimus_013606 [Dionaea muscipula]